ncbi:Fimbrial protein [compost metagenome]
MRTFFEAGPTTDLTNGRLNLTGSAAGNVQIELLNPDLTQVKAGFADASQNSKPVTLASGAGTLNYYAQYYAKGASTAGAANSSVTYTIAYQ